MQDSEIIARINSGETDAWRLLFDKYAVGLLRVGTGNGLSEADAEEVVNDVFLSAFALLREGRLGSKVGPWLRTVMKNRAVDRYRQNKPEPTQNKQETIGAIGECGAARISDEVRQHFSRALSKFRKDHPGTESPSIIANDTDILEWIAHHATNDDLADYLNINLNAARQRRLRALRRLKNAIDDFTESTAGMEEWD
jgi:DNA-directed RNA polymerase specialized sigma24 family protein